MPDKFERLIKFFTKLPGVGPRQATRLVLAMLNWSTSQLQEFSDAVESLKNGHIFCKNCFNLSETETCAICSNTKRDKTRIAVVEKVTDLSSMENTGVYKGMYHVLGGSINPADGVTPDRLRIKELVARVRSGNSPVTEVILATSPNTLGDTTAMYIAEELKPYNVAVTRLARGLASGSSVEYADEATLAYALKERK